MSPSSICVLPREKSRKGISVHHVCAWRSPVGLARRTNQRLDHVWWGRSQRVEPPSEGEGFEEHQNVKSHKGGERDLE
jgi:hypothetical protein